MRHAKEGARISRIARHLSGGMATIGPVKKSKIAKWSQNLAVFHSFMGTGPGRVAVAGL